MPNEDLTTSTGKQVDFLGGASAIDFMAQWIPSHSDMAISSHGGEHEWTIGWTELPSGSRIQISLQETAKEIVNPISLFARIYCHALISKVPDEGLSELCDSINNIYAFYREPPVLTALPAPPEKGSATLTPVREATGFEIVEE